MSYNSLAGMLSASLEGSNIGVPTHPDVEHEGGHEIEHIETIINEVDQHVDRVNDLGHELNQDPPSDSLEEFDNTDSMGGGTALAAGDRHVTVAELEEHLAEDEEAHAELARKIDETRQILGKVSSASELLHSAESLNEFTVHFLKPSLESIGNAVDNPLPALVCVDGVLSKPSMEALSKWVQKLVEIGKLSNKRLLDAIRFSKARNTRLHSGMLKRIEGLRTVLDRQGVLADKRFTLPLKTAEALLVDGSYTQDLPADLSRYSSFVVKVCEQAPDNYLKAIIEMIDPIAGLGLVESNTEFEAKLREIAAKAVNFDFYYNIEPNQPSRGFLGNVVYRKPIYSATITYPEWFRPVVDMVEKPPFEQIVTDGSAYVRRNPEVNSVTKDEALTLLDIIEMTIEQLDMVNKNYDRVLNEINGIANKALNKLQHLAYSLETEAFEPINLRMANFACSVPMSSADALYYPITLLTNNLDGALFAALLMVEKSVI